MKTILNDLTQLQNLTTYDARHVLIELASGKYAASQLAAFLTVYMMRPVTLDELRGFRDAMLELCVKVTLDKPVMDVCGTGGDGKNTFNISTLSAFVVAAAGQPVAKHGNYGVSSPCGSSNVLEYFGYRFTGNVDMLKRSLDKANICFMHAPLFHPAMKSVAPVRRELGLKTFFNMLGPMVNPAFPKKQFIGVFSLELARQYAYLYQQTDKQFMVVHSTDGYDEVSLTGNFKFYNNSGEGLVAPADLGFVPVEARAIWGGETIEESAEIFINVLKNEATPQQLAVVIANAALALSCAIPKITVEEALSRAREALESGKAYQAFKQFINMA